MLVCLHRAVSTHALPEHFFVLCVRVCVQTCLSDLPTLCVSTSLSNSSMPVQPLSHPIKTSIPEGTACLCVLKMPLSLSQVGLHEAKAGVEYLFHPKLRYSPSEREKRQLLCYADPQETNFLLPFSPLFKGLRIFSRTDGHCHGGLN